MPDRGVRPQAGYPGAMIRKLLGAPVKILKRILGREEATAPPAPVRRSPPPRPPPTRGSDDHRGGGHGHDHGGGGHDHGHDHGGGQERAPEPVREPVGGHDHGHDHGGGHDHGHDHGGGHAPALKQAKAAKAAAPAAPANVGMHINVTESDTPNPNAHKFTASVTVIEKGSLSFNAADEAASHPVSRYIWALGGIKGIFAVKDFVTVTKTPEADWSVLSPQIPGALRRGLVERDGS